jgi:hypothetical protein
MAWICTSAGLAHWDVYKVATLDVFKPKLQAVSLGEGGDATAQRSTAASSKASRVQHATHSAGKLPASFASNSPKEQKMQAYLADFQRVFQEFYPHRCEYVCQPTAALSCSAATVSAISLYNQTVYYHCMFH